MERKPRPYSAQKAESLTARLRRKAFLAILLVAGVPSVTAAQVACIPPASGVPGLPGPPDWLGTINPPLRNDLNDPRWNGAASLTWADGTSGDTANFRALQFGNNLFLSWFIQLPPNGNPQANVVYVGFNQLEGASPTNFAMTFSLTSLTPQSDGTDFAPAVFSVDNSGNPTALSGSLPPWISTNTRVWINQPANTFAVQTVVPISDGGINSGLNLGTDFSMWFEMQEALPPSNPATVWAAVFPDGRGGTLTAADVTSSGFNTVFPAPGTWAQFHRSSGPGDPACTLGGVSITWDLIGTLNPTPHQILFQSSGSPNPPPVNTFFASPTNGMTTPIPAGGITATFRIADWGSVADPNAPWTTIPGGQDVPSTAVIPAGATAANTNINFNWTVQNIAGGEQWLTEFQNGTKALHQCMLVELAGGALSTWVASHAYALNATIVDPAGNLQRATVAGTSGGTQPPFNGTAGGTTPDGTVTWTNQGPAVGPGLTFLNNSVYRNMDFVSASEFSRDAAINIKGLAPIGSGPRDIYLYILTKNMPSVVETAWKDLYNKRFGAPADRNPQKTQEVLAKTPAAEIREMVPTYHVYVFHDTGKHVTIDKQDYLITHPQSSFGYYVLPHEDVVNWVHDLQGATPIDPPIFYKIGVPNDGVVKVRTRIEAHESGPKGCFDLHLFGVLILLVGLFAVGLVIYLWRRTHP